MSYDTTSFRKNLKIEIDGEPYVIIEAVHVKPGKGVAFVKTKYRSLITGRVLEKNFRSGDKVKKPELEQRSMTYLYPDGDTYVFMDTDNYEQVMLTKEQVEEALPYMLDNLQVDVLFYQGKAISIDLPTFVEMEITYCEPGVRGDTAQGVTKPATLSTGHQINVPLFVKEGETVKVDTRTGEFVERVNK